jgi:hypothetical protein
MTRMLAADVNRAMADRSICMTPVTPVARRPAWERCARENGVASNVACDSGAEMPRQRSPSSMRASAYPPIAMKPDRSILEASFRYVPSVSTSVPDTWRCARR